MSLFGVGKGGRERHRRPGGRFGFAPREGRGDGLGQHRAFEGEGVGDAQMSKKSFIRELAIPSAVIAWNFSASTVSGG